MSPPEPIQPPKAQVRKDEGKGHGRDRWPRLEEWLRWKKSPAAMPWLWRQSGTARGGAGPTPFSQRKLFDLAILVEDVSRCAKRWRELA